MNNGFPNEISYTLWKFIESEAKLGRTVPLGYFSLLVNTMEEEQTFVEEKMAVNQANSNVVKTSSLHEREMEL